ncbi:MAG: OmpA family protein [Bdellovibrionales bacterium]|nr:OmpA family protein [Bdellovibrionales bacterium]
MKRLNRLKKGFDENIDTEGSWAISYGDMITLLLSFFVLFYTVDPQAEKQQSMQDQIAAELEGLEKVNSTKANKNIMNLGKEAGESVQEMVIHKLGAKTYKDKKRLIVEFPGVSFFKLGYIDLNQQGKEAIDQFLKVYKPYMGQFQLRVQAFTDSRKVVSPHLRFKDNLELSALRSIAAMRYLQKAGVPLSRMKLSGYGELKLTHLKLKKFKEKSKDALALARKVILIIEPEENWEDSV